MVFSFPPPDRIGRRGVGLRWSLVSLMFFPLKFSHNNGVIYFPIQIQTLPVRNNILNIPHTRKLPQTLHIHRMHNLSLKPLFTLLPSSSRVLKQNHLSLTTNMQIPRHPRRGTNAMIRTQPGNIQNLRTMLPYQLLEVRPYEGRVDIFNDGNFIFQGCGEGLECVTWLGRV